MATKNISNKILIITQKNITYESQLEIANGALLAGFTPLNIINETILLYGGIKIYKKLFQQNQKLLIIKIENNQFNCSIYQSDINIYTNDIIFNENENPILLLSKTYDSKIKSYLIRYLNFDKNIDNIINIKEKYSQQINKNKINIISNVNPDDIIYKSISKIKNIIKNSFNLIETKHKIDKIFIYGSLSKYKSINEIISNIFKDTEIIQINHDSIILLDCLSQAKKIKNFLLL